MSAPTPHEIGEFVDRVSAQEPNSHYRTPAAVAGRFIEEAVELCLATGVSPTEIMAHVMDAVHNQCAKAGRRAERVIYPSYYTQPYDDNEIAEEIADCNLLLKDLQYVTGLLDTDTIERTKWDKFTQRTFYVSEQGTLYAIKK